MDILNSDWLIRMLEKSSPKPHARLLALFDILEDWQALLNTASPSVREQVGERFPTQSKAKLLQDFLTTEAAKAGAAMPEILANQLYFMANAALIDALQPNKNAAPGYAFMHAKSAAKALILAQTKSEFHIAKPVAYTIAASFFGAMIIAGTWFSMHETTTPATLTQLQAEPSILTTAMASPENTAALIAEIELMRHGNCQLIEAIQLPDSQKGIYINMVVHGRVSTDPHEQKIAMELLKKTRCNYTPMLMANSK